MGFCLLRLTPLFPSPFSSLPFFFLSFVICHLSFVISCSVLGEGLARSSNRAGGRMTLRTLTSYIVPRAGLQPARSIPPKDFKSFVSSNSTTPAKLTFRQIFNINLNQKLRPGGDLHSCKRFCRPLPSCLGTRPNFNGPYSFYQIQYFFQDLINTTFLLESCCVRMSPSS